MNTTDTTPSAPPIVPPKPVIRPGIHADTLEKLGIRHVTPGEAKALVGLEAAGILIPFPGVIDDGKPYYRLRLSVPIGDKKYHQRHGSNVHNYIPADIALYNTSDLVGTEGEFKALSCGESGIPAFGTSGFYSWRVAQGDQGHALEPALAKTIERLAPKRLVFIGDADTALNSQFSDAMASLAQMTQLQVVLPRIPYDAPDGKGLDDIRGKLGHDAFILWFAEALRNAEVVTTTTGRDYLALNLLKRETAALQRLQGEAREKAKGRLVKLASNVDPLYAGEIAEIAKAIFSIKGTDFNRSITEARRKAKAERVSAEKEKVEYDPTVFERLLVVGERFYAKTWDDKKKRWSDAFAPCEKSMAEHALRAAGYIAEEESDQATLVCGAHPNLNKLHSALYHLHAHRVDEIVYQLFQPFGRKALKSGKFQFNNSQVIPPIPVGNIKGWNDPRVSFTGAYLSALLGKDQLDHFTSVISYTYTNACAKSPKKPLALFFIGDTDIGKSLAIDCLIPLIHGQTAAGDAHRLMLGENGASSVLDNFVCKISDKELGDQRQIKKIQSGMLSLLADHTFGGKLMYENVTVQEVFNLFTFSCNRDGSALGLLKGLPESIRKKIAVYDCGLGLVSLKGKVADEILAHPGRQLERELPYVCSLLRNWSSGPVAQALKEPRFGVRSYFAKGIEASFERTSEESIVYEALLGHNFHGQTSTKIFDLLSSLDGGSRQSLVSIKSTRFREVLYALAKQYPEFIVVRRYDKNTLFDIYGVACEKRLDSAIKSPSSVDNTGVKAVLFEPTMTPRESVTLVPKIVPTLPSTSLFANGGDKYRQGVESSDAESDFAYN